MEASLEKKVESGGFSGGEMDGDVLELRYVDIETVAYWEGNYKLHDIGGVISSIRKHGYKDPAKYEPRLNGGRGGIVEGNGRTEALVVMRDEGMEVPRGVVEDGGEWYVPVLFGVDAVSEALAEAYGVDHNATTLGGGDFDLSDHMRMWDDGFVRKLRELNMTGEGAVMFDGDDIQRLVNMEEREKGEGEERGEVVEPKMEIGEKLAEEWGVEVGQIWKVGDHRIGCGDCTDWEFVLRVMESEEFVDCMWTDPPYGVDYVGKTDDALKIENDDAWSLPELLDDAFANADKLLVDGAPIYIAHPAGVLSLEFGAAFLRVGWHFHETLVWVKDSMVLGHSDYHYKHEPILYGWKGKNRSWFAGRDQVSVFEIPRPKASREHPIVKPVELIEAQLKNSTRDGDIVYDPFMGSGSTIVACERMGRIGAGIDLDPRYFAVSLQRLVDMGLEAELL